MIVSELRIFDLYGEDISSRARGVELRIAIEGHAGGLTQLDFANVRTLSDSFADEVFGVLAEQHGAEWIRDHVRCVNLSPEARRTILEVVHHRLTLAHR